MCLSGWDQVFCVSLSPGPSGLAQSPRSGSEGGGPRLGVRGRPHGGAGHGQGHSAGVSAAGREPAARQPPREPHAAAALGPAPGCGHVRLHRHQPPGQGQGLRPVAGAR